MDYTKTKNRKALLDTFIYCVVLYDDKMKVLFNLKSGQKNELLLNLIFPDYPDGNGGEDENGAKEKETENSVSQSGCSYTPVMVHPSGLEPEPKASEAFMVSNSTTGAFDAIIIRETGRKVN